MRLARPLSAALILLLIAALGSPDVTAQSINPKLLTERWQARWIQTPGGGGTGVYLFRRTFDLAAAPARFVVHASADQRYQLFVNGRRMATGPARGDLDHWRFETVDIGPALKPGPNVVAAIVWNFGALAPMAQVSQQTGFLLQGDAEAEAIVNTGKQWKTSADAGWTLLPIDRKAIFYEYFVAGPGEQIDGAKRAWGWERLEFDDAAWTPAEEIGVAAPRAIRDSPSRWFLVPRAIPLHGGRARTAVTRRACRGRRRACRRAEGRGAMGRPGARQGDGAAGSRDADHRIPGGGGQWWQGRADHTHLRRGASRTPRRREEGRQGPPEPDRWQGHHRAYRPISPGWRPESHLHAALVADVPICRSGGRDRRRAGDHQRHALEILRLSGDAEGEVHVERSGAPHHLRRGLANGAALLARDLHGHAVLGAAPVHRRRADPGAGDSVPLGRRPARAQRHPAVRRVEDSRWHHPEPLPHGAAAAHPAVLAFLDRHAARRLVVRRRSRAREALPRRQPQRARLVQRAAGVLGPARPARVVELRRLDRRLAAWRAALRRWRREHDPEPAARARAA